MSMRLPSSAGDVMDPLECNVVGIGNLLPKRAGGRVD
jgi:hypothetical protein